ncbi:PAP2 superfamily protein [Labilithrix luteola]|uniref:PAP2 superfamily protein n=1 Tax=Labilithrix luteola TaxID=1391654 RepID=A0A0K1QCE5_9BACT|nr:PAP2 superfamily protein [Labilithrix luteola]
MLFALYQGFRSELRVEHVLMIVVAAVLAYTGPRTKELLLGLYPLALVAVFYDAMRPIQKVGLTPERVHLCDLRNLELGLFGMNVGGQRMTPHDWFYLHHTPALDVFSSIPYATFLAACVACCIYLYIHDRQAMRRFSWGFLVLNVLAFLTYHLVPAGPPWYFHAHGCTVDLATRATEGPALERVDLMLEHRLGITFFHGMYARASSVFGALPSLHCAYPILILVEGWRSFGWKLRFVAMGFACWMIFSAVYLDHHWIIDALLGGFYAVITTVVLGSIGKLKSDVPAPAPVTTDIADMLEPAGGAPVSGGGE